ncbi:MAG: homoaconitate hydratase family protein [Bacteroidetes bacterium]|nr:homoaconitate hydratase family protein [Bacteroidota bacterium]
MPTIVEKILSRASGSNTAAHPIKQGDYLSCEVDLAMVHDSSGPRRLAPKLDALGMSLKHPEKLVVITDHYVPAHDDASREIQRFTKQWVTDQGIQNFYPEMGICHVVLPESGLLQPGMLVVGGDSHSPTGGAFGAYMFGVGATDMAGVAATGRIWVKVPKTHLANLHGTLDQQVFAKDIILYLCGQYGMDMAGYQAIEFGGSASAGLAMQARMTLCNMAAELGAQVGMIAPDAVTAEWLAERTTGSNMPSSLRDEIPFSALQSDPGSHDGTHFDVDLDQLAPQAAAPHSPANSTAINAHEPTKFNIAYIGACTGAKIDDLRAAAAILEGRKIADTMRLLIAPASRADIDTAADEGVMQIFEDAGAQFLPTACGMCAGYGPDRRSDGDVWISSTARNFKGRMGAPGSQVWLASPASVASAAITGILTDPREMSPEKPITSKIKQVSHADQR